MANSAARLAIAQRRCRFLVLVTVLALGQALALPLAARPQPKPVRMDLAVRPADVRLKPPVVVFEPAFEEPEVPGVGPANPVAEIDQVDRTEIPDRRRAKSGLEIGDSDLLQELLEDKTIPIFRVTVEPPF